MTGPAPAPAGWSATHAHVRAVVAGTGLVIAGVAAGRPDLVLLAAPLALVALWAGLTRPQQTPEVAGTPGALTMREGEEISWAATVARLPDHARVASLHPGQRFLEVEPAHGFVQHATSTGPTSVRYALRPTRWGRRTLGDPAVAAYDRWYAWRWGPVLLPGARLVVLPAPASVDAAAPAPHPRGLVGMERAARVGEGTEFSKVRPFQVGDRLRRIHWPVSARTGQLHVTATHADEDAHVALLVDALNDVGESTGVTGTPSSMDVTVRATATLAEHFLRRGDRVGLRVFGAWGVSLLPATSGQVQLRRILDALCLIEPGTARGEKALAARQGLVAGTLVVLLSPLIDPAATQQVAILHRAGLDIVVVDTLPAQLVTSAHDPQALAWRIRMLERRIELDRLASLGIAVVGWSGPRSLDQVLRDLTRRSAAPRLVPR